MDDKITKQKLDRYFKITSEALEKVKKSVAKGKSSHAREIIEMVSNYLSDARYFEKQGRIVDAFASLNYARGWLDAGARLKVFDVDDKRLFAA